MSKPKTDIFYPFYVGDYRKDTARLSCEQHGAYRQLIDEYWVAGPLPDNDELLARIVGLDVRVWRKHRAVVMAFFKLKGGLWRHKRIDFELSRANSRKAKAKASAEARWGGVNARSNANASPEHMLEQCSDDALHSHSHHNNPPIQGITGEVGSSSEVQQEGSGARIVPLAGRAGR